MTSKEWQLAGTLRSAGESPVHKAQAGNTFRGLLHVALFGRPSCEVLPCRSKAPHLEVYRL